MPASDCADDLVRISGPSEGLRLGIVFDNEAIDGGLQIDDRDEDIALQSPLAVRNQRLKSSTIGP